MRTPLLSLALFLSLISIKSRAQSPGLVLNTGMVLDFENVFTTNTFSYDSRVNLTLFFPINQFVDIGPRIDYFTVREFKALPISASVRTHFLKKKWYLNLTTSLGYALSDDPTENRPQLNLFSGGVFVNTGLNLSYPIYPNTRIIAGIDYTLQEKKFVDQFLFFEFVESYMIHLPGFNIGVAINW